MNYSPRLAEAKLVLSAGSVDDKYDNALVQTIIGLYNYYAAIKHLDIVA